jgi:F-box-like
MDKGNFDASQLKRRRIKSVDLTSESNRTNSLYTKGGLREILGVSFPDGDGGNQLDEDDIVTSEQVEKTMTSLEDVDDVNALNGSRKEAAEEFKEFDESIEYRKESDDDDDAKVDVAEENPKNENSTEEKELENEIAAWQENAGVDPSVIESSLLPIERYGVRFCQVIDPYYSIFAVKEYREKSENQSDGIDEIDVSQIECEKEIEECRAFEEGDLLATHPRPDDLIRQINLYRREKSRLNGIKKRRRLTGESWEYRTDPNQSHYWYNIDTGEALWDKPKVLIDLEAYNQALERKWSFLPWKPLIHVMSFLLPFPDRFRASEVCSRWCKAAKDPSFVRHVYPVELGAYTRDEAKMEFNHFRTIDDAVKSSLPGDTIGECNQRVNLQRRHLLVLTFSSLRIWRWALLAKPGSCR